MAPGRNSVFPDSERPTLRTTTCTSILKGLTELQEQADYLLQVAQTDGFNSHPRVEQIQALIHLSSRFLSAARKMCHDCDLIPEPLTEEESRLSQQVFVVPEEEVAKVADELSLSLDSLFDPEGGKLKPRGA
jgi:hypothetical protein